MLLKPAFFASAQLRKLSPPEGGSTAGGGTGSGTRVAVVGGAGIGVVVVGAGAIVVVMVVGGSCEVVAWAVVDVADAVVAAGVDVVAVTVVDVGAAGGEPLPHPASTKTRIPRPTTTFIPDIMPEPTLIPHRGLPACDWRSWNARRLRRDSARARTGAALANMG